MMMFLMSATLGEVRPLSWAAVPCWKQAVVSCGQAGLLPQLVSCLALSMTGILQSSGPLTHSEDVQHVVCAEGAAHEGASLQSSQRLWSMLPGLLRQDLLPCLQDSPL